MARTSPLLPSAPRGGPIRRWATRTFSGRAILIGAAIKVFALAVGLIAGRSALVELIDTLGDVHLVAGAVILGFGLFVDLKQRLLWRVRRKLTVSYIFIGFVPALLIITFFLLCGLLLLNNLSSSAIYGRVREVQEETQLLARMAAAAVGQARTVDEMRTAVQTQQAIGAARYSGVSYAIVPAGGKCSGTGAAAADAPVVVVVVGTWKHTSPPQAVPAWVPCTGHAGLMYYADEGRRVGNRAPGRLMTRAVAWPPSGGSRAVIVDVPVTSEVSERLRADTGIELMEVGVVTDGGSTQLESLPPATGSGAVSDATEGALAAASDGSGLFSRRFGWVAFFQWTEWETGTTSPLTVPIRTSLADLYNRISPVERFDATFAQMLLVLVAIVGALFLLIQLVAFGMGLALARSITGSVHELFAGTERVRQGDFTGRIAIRSRDQLGELADSFNSMTASIEDLLQQKAEKERLEQELRIARSIQMSLLPQGPMTVPGISLTAHCEPAREVGGDYYDFLPIDEHTIGILVADVSGKGTSAALYMAELKGIVLSLCERYTSPRELLIEADRIISRHLDTASFITITYLVVDLRAGVLRYSRAGHCPLIYVPGPYAPSRVPVLLTPDGMVVGLQLDEGRTFARLLEEISLPLGAGDVFLLYTDGISEAMNGDGECFGDTRLAELMGAHSDLPSDELRERILRDIGVFAGSASQHDDMTMVLLRVDAVAGVVEAAVPA